MSSLSPAPPMVALVHFCDNHGPSALFCTRRANSREDVDSIMKAGAKSGANGTKTCAACTSLDAETRCIITKDEDDVFFSCNAADAGDPAASALKRAALRALSFESASTPEAAESGGEMIFKEANSSFVLSSIFKVRDAENVRGFKRTYGVLVLVPSRSVLLHLSRRISAVAQRVVAHVQVSALKKFQEELPDAPAGAAASVDLASSSRQMTPSGAVSVRPPRPLAQAQASAHPYRPPRSLDLITYQDVYLFIHRNFTKMLKLIFRSRQEIRSLTPPSTTTPLPTQLTAAEAESLAALGRKTLADALAAMAVGATIKLCGEFEETKEAACAMRKFAAAESRLQENPDVSSVFLKQDCKGHLSRATLAVDLAQGKDVTAAVDTSLPPVVQRLTDAILAIAEDGDESDGAPPATRLSSVALESRAHDFLSAARLFQARAAAASPSSWPVKVQDFNSLDLQRMAEYARRKFGT